MNGTCHISPDHFSQKLAKHFGVNGSQNLQNFIIGKFLSKIKSNTLVEKAERISHGTISRFRYISDCFFLSFYTFNFEQFIQSGRDSVYGDSVEIISLASG